MFRRAPPCGGGKFRQPVAEENRRFRGANRSALRAPPPRPPPRAPPAAKISPSRRPGFGQSSLRAKFAARPVGECQPARKINYSLAAAARFAVALPTARRSVRLAFLPVPVRAGFSAPAAPALLLPP